MSDYNRRSRKSRNAARKSKKPRPSNKKGPSRTSRRSGTKARFRKGSATWCRLRGVPAHGEGQNNKKNKR